MCDPRKVHLDLKDSVVLWVSSSLRRLLEKVLKQWSSVPRCWKAAGADLLAALLGLSVALCQTF